MWSQWHSSEIHDKTIRRADFTLANCLFWGRCWLAFAQVFQAGCSWDIVCQKSKQTCNKNKYDIYYFFWKNAHAHSGTLSLSTWILMAPKIKVSINSVDPYAIYRSEPDAWSINLHGIWSVPLIPHPYEKTRLLEFEYIFSIGPDWAIYT